MATAEELLSEVVYVHNHTVTDSDTYFVIDPISRKIDNTARKKNVIMQRDHDSEVFTFELARYVEGHDMSLCNRVKVHWNNIDGATGEENAETTDIEDLHISGENEDVVICSWTISRNSTQLVGILSFLIQYQCIDENGNSTYEWHTDSYDEIEIKATRNNGEASIIEYTDILEQWRTRIFGAGDSVVSTITTTAKEQVAAIKEEAEAQEAAIRLKGEATLATIPEDYTEIYNMADRSLRTRANAIVVEAEGEPVVVKDCSDDYLRGLKIYGRTEQVVTTGAQLANLPDVESVTSAGVTWVCKNGVVRAYGRTTGTSSTASAIQYSILGQTGTFYISGSVDPISVYCMVTKGGNTLWYKETSFTLDGTETQALVYCQVFSSGVSVNTAVRPMLNVGDTALDWEPYSGGEASPNPNWPQELESVENPTMAIYSGNIANANSIEAGANTSAVSSSDGYIITCTGGADNPYASSPIYLPMDMLRGRTVILKADRITNSQDSSGKGGNVQLNIRDSVAMKYVAISPNNLRAVTTIPEDVSRVDLNIYTNNSATLFESENTTVVEGLSLNVVDIDWDSYKEEQLLTIEHTIPGLPVTSGGNHIDSDGQRWICDEIDFERGVYVQRCGHHVYDGSDDENWNGIYTHDTKKYVYIEVPRGSIQYTTPLKCNYAKQGAWSSKNVCFINNFKEFVVGGVDLEEALTSVATFRAYLAEHPIELVYVLETPVEIDLTEEELYAFSRLHSNYQTTTIMNNFRARMDVKYNVDTQTYFDNSRGATDEQVKMAVSAYLTENPVEVNEALTDTEAETLLDALL